jgi:hypothetical protein
MRNMSFLLTTRQVRRQEKTVTRRLGWTAAKVGDIVQPIVRGQGIKRGGKVERIGPPIRFVSVRREPLDMILVAQVRLHYNSETWDEGFPDMNGREFVDFFCRANECSPGTEVTRIAFEYLSANDARNLRRREKRRKA